MGQSASRDQIRKYEKLNWTKPHELLYNTELRNKQLSQLQRFKGDLKICYYSTRKPPSNFQHWIVTDGKWVMEFGSEDLSKLGNGFVVSILLFINLCHLCGIHACFVCLSHFSKLAKHFLV